MELTIRLGVLWALAQEGVAGGRVQHDAVGRCTAGGGVELVGFGEVATAMALLDYARVELPIGEDRDALPTGGE